MTEKDVVVSYMKRTYEFWLEHVATEDDKLMPPTLQALRVSQWLTHKATIEEMQIISKRDHDERKLSLISSKDAE